MVEEHDAQLKTFIEAHNAQLNRILQHYALRMGLATPQDAPQVAEDILNDVVLEALRSVDRLRTPENPLPWLLGIGLNIIRRRHTKRSRLNQREPLLHDLYLADHLNEAEVIDHFIGVATQQQEDDGTFNRILAHLLPEEQHLLRLAILYEMDGEALGQALHITPGAARVRLHRTLKRLRQFWGTQERIFDDE
ncbi:MAG: hypothetical protein OHK0046_20330 [Anaerolineae bacterium]